MDTAEAMVVTRHDSTWGNIGLDRVTEASACHSSVPVPERLGWGAGRGRGGGEGGCRNRSASNQGPWISRMSPTAVPTTA